MQEGKAGRDVSIGVAPVSHRTITAAATLEPYDEHVVATIPLASANSYAVTLPPLSARPGQKVLITTARASGSYVDGAVTVAATADGIKTALISASGMTETDNYILVENVMGLFWRVLEQQMGNQTVTLSSNAGTLSALEGKITTEALTTAAGAAATLTITNTLVDANDIILVTRNGGTSDEGTPEFTATPGSGSFVILLENRHASAAFDGTFIFGFKVIKQIG